VWSMRVRRREAKTGIYCVGASKSKSKLSMVVEPKGRRAEGGGGGGGGGRRGAEYGPEGVCLGEGLRGGGEAAFGVGCAAEGEEESLPSRLAGFDVGFDLRAGEELGAREDSAVIAGVSEVDERRRFDANEEGDRDNVHRGVYLFC